MLFLLFLQFSFSIFRTDHALSISVVAPWGNVSLADQIFSFCVHYSQSIAKNFLLKATNFPENLLDENQIWKIARETIPSHLIPLLTANIDFGAKLPASIFNGFSGSPSIYDNNLTFETDFVNGERKSDSKIFYLDIIKDAKKINQLLKNNENFILRTTPAQKGAKSFLHGFGVEIRPFKYSMEYNVKNREAEQTKIAENFKVFDETTQNISKQIKDMEPNISSINFDNFESKFAGFLSKKLNQFDFLPFLRDVTNNWPLFLKEIADSPQDELSVARIHALFGKMSEKAYINGRLIQNFDDFDIFTFLNMLEQERTMNDILSNHFHLTDSEISQFSTKTVNDHQYFYFDYQTDLIQFYNDIEKDDQYAEWSKNKFDIFNYEHRMPHVRKNLFTVILYCDPSTNEGLNQLTDLVFLVKRLVPITLGVLPIFRMNNHISRKVAFAYHHLAMNDLNHAIDFLIRTYHYQHKEILKQNSKVKSGTKKNGNKNEESNQNNVNPEEIPEIIFAQAYEDIARLTKTYKKWNNLNELYFPDSHEYQRIKSIAKYYKEHNLSPGKVCANGLISNAPLNYEIYLRMIKQSFDHIIPLMKQENFQNSIDVFEVSVLNFLRKASIVLEKVDTQIFTSKIEAIPLSEMNFDKQMKFIDNFNKIEWLDSNSTQNVNTYLFIFDNSSINGENKDEIQKFDIIKKFNNEKHLSNIKIAINPNQELFHLNSIISPTDLPCIVINGRIITYFDINSIEKLRLIDKWNYHFILNSFPDFLKSNENILSSKFEQNFYLATLLNSWKLLEIKRGQINEFIFGNNILTHTENHTDLSLSISINPFSKNMQRLSGIFEYLSRKKIVNVKVCLIPYYQQDYFQTLSSYFRNAIPSSNNQISGINGDTNENLSDFSGLGGDEAIFTYLNDCTTYSSIIDVPNSWQVESLNSPFDLDNILLAELTPKVHRAEYILTNVIVEGSVKNLKNELVSGMRLDIIPPKRNTSSTYYNENYASSSDTLVIGKKTSYFQLMGTIGLNKIIINSNSLKINESDHNIYHVEVNSFTSKYNIIKLKHEVLKQINSQERNYKNSSRVDVFAVASGHLYERLTKIMMISVKRQTNSRVTFWLLNNFLSPQFKASLPAMAEKYGFEYKLVKYKWPHFIYPQQEKQRIIWGNKILFLDVLFPVDLERIIYIDADQIVRTDMNELMRMDFEGAPYAFTPFCDSRKETEPYRFWKTGYWKNYLEDKKYHISALFAIDLPTFRKMGAGNILRKYYQRLAPDKYSLANLDQDLPNFVQKKLPIFSLPQNWLWCETWCSDETMDQAKTIDLCNNPLTKKPKLEIAQTRVAEWPSLDQEARKIIADNDAYEKLFFP
ncbi:hypothetical protein TRFO_26144 [Tritrichomonas foetus]|uniref:Glucosyltransferase 24 catalytic domain-containing protein n=1 Tax=Tritrichomonas foetus TaxID=1144522 RepID=A0A1J4K8E0_9EUKA|nr:hypothetical protein TRFO_26144 [Tritrichomonas foetus]|eukprot:OHT05934.1 hypothetical protein TRFO_26144 [Tritrichomonas foetus]